MNDPTISREEIEAIVLHRFTGVPTLRTVIELSARPNPSSDPKQAQPPLDKTVVWEWSAEGYEWYENRDRFTDGRPEITTFAYSVRPQDSWTLHYDPADGRILRAEHQRASLKIPMREFAILPTLLGMVVPGRSGTLGDIWKLAKPPSLSRVGSLWRAEFTEQGQVSHPLEIELAFDSDRKFALSSQRFSHPTVLVTRHDGKQEPLQWLITVDEWMEVPVLGTEERFWLPRHATLTTNSGVTTMRIRSVDMGFSVSDIRPRPELPFKTQVHETPERPGGVGRDYVVGGASALSVLMEEHASAARSELAKREKSGRHFDARPQTIWVWPRWLLVGSLLVGALSGVWLWRKSP